MQKEREIPQIQSEDKRLKVGKNKLKKITAEGPFDGKQILVFGADGSATTKAELQHNDFMKGVDGQNATIRTDQAAGKDQSG